VLAQDKPPPTATGLDAGLHLYFAGRYDEAAAMARDLRADAGRALASYELRTSALHFLVKREVAGAADKKAALAACGRCAALLTDLTAEIAAGRALARQKLEANDRDDEARFYLGKIDLTHVWLHLETLGRRTGWSEYWEARKSLDAVLVRQPDHLRARVARAWIDYIVDTRVPRGFRWMLGGGDKKGALAAADQAARSTSGDTYAVIEARFALWEMLTREGRRDEARAVARVLYEIFPENRDLARAVGGT
jgi:tetratricopeptide (TPR) repeat protein